MNLLKGIAGKVAGGLVALAVIAGGISWFQMNPADRHQIVAGTMHILAWLGVVLVLPWASFFVIGGVARLESNLAGALLVFAYTASEAVLLAWLFSWSLHGALSVVFFIAGVLICAAYNLLACDWIAEKLE